MTRRLVHLVADYGDGDLAAADVIQRLLAALEDAVVQLTKVPPFDTVAAGFCVAQLALTDGPPDRLVIHDVGTRGRTDERFCAGRGPDGVLVMGANAGYAWSFAVDGLHALCHLDVPATRTRLHTCDSLPLAARHLVAQHPHAVWDVVPRDAFPAAPADVIAYEDGYGNLETTLAWPPAPLRQRVRVRVGRRSATAIVSDGISGLPEGELALVPTNSGWVTRRGGRRRFAELVATGGSAAERLGRPRGGTAVRILAAQPW